MEKTNCRDTDGVETVRLRLSRWWREWREGRAPEVLVEGGAE